MRLPVDGTVPVGGLKDDDAYFRGKNADGSFVARAPLAVTETVLKRGQERFNIYCAPCHSRTGAGNGLVVQRGFHLPVNLASDHTRSVGDGEIFDYISNGIRNMPAYSAQIPEEDRWAIVTWVRVLQRSQYAQVTDVPADQRDKIEPEGAK
jgi:mono/diheme cytochrome c family protein